MKYFSKLTLSLLFIPALLKAQSNFKPGYVVDLKGDTLKGLVDYREWDNNPSSFNFKKSNNGTTANYTLETAKAFAIIGFEYFERYTLPISQDNISIRDITNKGADSGAIVKTVFLKRLQKGRVLAFYSYADQIKTRFYIAETVGDVKELVYKVYMNIEESDKPKTVTRYKSQLQYIAQKNNISSDKLARQIAIAPYSEHELFKIVNAMNGGTKDNSFVNANAPGTRLFLGVSANYSSLKFDGRDGPVPSGSKQISILPRVTGGADFFFDKSTQRLLFRAELSLSANSFNFPPMPVGVTTATLTFKQYNFTVTPQVVYNFYATDSFKIFACSGMSFSLSSNKNNYHVEYTGFAGSDSKYPEFDSFWATFPIKAGIVINNKLEINLGYNIKTTIASAASDDGEKTSGYSALITTYSAGINFLFGK